MRALKLVCIDCWDTILMDRKEWAGLIEETLWRELLNGGRLVERSKAGIAFDQEARNFRARLEGEQISVPNKERVINFARLLEISLSVNEVAKVSASVDSVILQPPPELNVGVSAFLAELAHKAIEICIISNTGWFSGRAIRIACNYHEISRFVTHMVFSDEVGRAKPSTRIFRDALEASRCIPEEAVHIGDTIATDVKGALASGIWPIELRNAGTSESRGWPAFYSFDRVMHYLASHFQLPGSD